MKFFATVSLLALSFNSIALERSSELDFTKLYGNIDAGIYDLKIKLVPKKSLSKGTISTKVSRFDNDYTCTTSAGFDVGELNYTLAKRGTNWKVAGSKKIMAHINYTVEGTECDLSLENLRENQMMYASVALNESPFTLPIIAPSGYESLAAYISPFSSYLNLSVMAELRNGHLEIEPKEVLTSENIDQSNPHNRYQTYYYVFAKQGLGHLSLKGGHAELK